MDFDSIPDTQAVQNAPPPLRFDDLPDTQQVQPVRSNAPLKFDDIPTGNQFDEPESSPGGAFARQAVKQAPAAAAGWVGGVAGAESGAVAGAAVAPFLGPLAPVAPLGGAIIGGLAGAGGASYLATKGEDWVLDKLGLRSGTGMLSDRQQQTDIEQHPYASEAGGLADVLIGGAAGGATRGVRAIGGAIMGGTTAAQEYADTGDVNPVKVGMSAVAGAVAPNPRKWVTDVTAPVTRMVSRPQTSPDAAGRADLKGSQAEKKDIASANDVTTVAAGVAHDNGPAPKKNVRTAANTSEGSERDYRKNAPADAVQGIRTVQSEPNVNTDAIHPDLQAALGGENEETITQVPSVGSRPMGASSTPGAVSGGPPEQVPGQAAPKPVPDNPGSVPPIETGIAEAGQAQGVGQGQVAQRQQQAVAQADPELAHRIGMLTIQGKNASQIFGDLKGAMTPPVIRDIRSGLGLNPQAREVIQGAIKEAMQRPIVQQAMPSIANSSRDIKGPVIVDPSIDPKYHPSLAVHETVESRLMALGMKYPQAHRIATIAERMSVEASGENWKEYSEHINDRAKKIEGQKVDPATYAQYDLHVDPEQAIGHHTEKAGPLTPEDARLNPDPNSPSQIFARANAARSQGQTKPGKVYFEAIKHLKSVGLNKVADELAKLPAGEREAKAAQLLAMERNKGGEAEVPNTTRVPSKQYKLSNGLLAANEQDRVRKQTVLDATKSAFEKLKGNKEDVIPTSTSDKAKLIDRLKQAVAHATQQNKGEDPLKAYRALNDPNWRWVRAAKQVIDKPTPKNISEFIANEKLILAGGAKDVQQTARIKADSELRPGPSPVEEAGEPATSRETFEPMPSVAEGKDNSYVEAQNEVRDYVNNLPSKDYDTLAEQYDLHNELDEPADPKELLGNFKQTIAETTKKRPGVIERVPAEEVAGTPKPIRTRADFGTAEPRPKGYFAPTKEGGKASEGRVLTGEEKAKAIAAMNMPAATRNVDERLASEEKATNNPENITRQAMRRGDMPKSLGDATDRLKKKLGVTQASGTPIQNTWDAATERMTSYLKDKDGKIAFKPFSWMQKRLVDAFSPHALPAVNQYVESLGDQFNEHRNKGQNRDSEIHANAMTAPEHTAEEWAQIAHAHDGRDIASLPQNLKDTYNDHIKPLMDKYGRDYDWVRTNAKELDLPRRYDDGTVAFQPLLREGAQVFDREKENDPVTRLRTLSDYAGPLQERSYFALDNGQGNRIVFKPGDGEISIFKTNPKTGNTTTSKVATVDFDGNPGDRITLKIQGKADTFSVDHATAREIMASVKDEDGVPLKYHESPLTAWSNAVRGVGQVRDNVMLLQKIENSKPFLENATKSAKEAEAKGYIQTTLPQMKDWWMEPRIAEAMDDFAHPGFSDLHLQGLRNAAQGLIKTMYTFGPFVHALNEADLWATSRGFDWLNPAGYKSIVKNGYKAIKSVHTQDDFQRQIRAVGGNPMLASVITRDLITQIAEKAGLEITRNSPAWDPIAKSFGISTGDLGRGVYKESSKIMWKLSDILLTQKVMENMDIHKMSLTDAVNDAHKFISDYRIGSRVANSRFIAKFLSDPATSLFGRYHMGLWNSMGHMSRNLVRGTPEERTKAAGQLIASGVMAYLIYPALDNAAKYVTGNDDASFGRRGFATIPNSLSELAQGKRDYTKTAADAFTPSLPLNALGQVIHNVDWKGQPIIQKMDYTKHPERLATAAAEFGDVAGSAMVAPYATLSTGLHEPGATPASVAGKFATAAVGITNPTDQARKYMHNQPKYNEQDLAKRAKKNAGPLERLTNSLTR